MSKQAINPPNLFDSRAYGFSQMVVAPHGRHVFVSGQVAWDQTQQIIGTGDLALQTRTTLDNLRHAMKAAGGTLADVLMLRIYKVRFEQEDGPIISAQLKEYFGTDAPPASTWISVDGLANPDFMIEIEAQAVIGSE